MKLWDLMDMDLYRRMLFEKYVRVNKHPTLPLSILNYTEKAQFENVWNEVTARCRGLVIDNKFSIVARPFDKFLNYGQNQADVFLKDYPVEVTDKMDGSLGIVFEYAGIWHVATRGSFISDQAVWATKFLQSSPRGYNLLPWHEETYLVEIIYPGNRIVLNYGDREDLVLLAARNAVTGAVRAAKDVAEWQGPKTTTFPYKTLTEALEAPPRTNAEGYVVYFPTLDYRVKIKQEDYIIAHRLISGLNDRSVWEALMTKGSIDDYICVIPDEFHEYVRETTDILLEQFHKVKQAWYDSYSLALETLPEEFSRRDFAKLAVETSCSSALFNILDNKDVSEMAWKTIRPEAIINGVQRYT